MKGKACGVCPPPSLIELKIRIGFFLVMGRVYAFVVHYSSDNIL